MYINEYNSLKWTITIGTVPGYGMSEQERMNEKEFTEKYRTIALEVEEETGIYISCVFYNSRTVYKTEWGCPEEGELTYTLSGSCNREFSEPDKYCKALKLLAGKLKAGFEQSTVLLEMVPMEEVYYKG